MEIVIFESKRFYEIPNQDNPVFDTTTYTGETLRASECLMLCKVSNPKTSGVLDGFTVIYVPIKGEIISKGKFWHYGEAELFINALRKSFESV